MNILEKLEHNAYLIKIQELELKCQLLSAENKSNLLPFERLFRGNMEKQSNDIFALRNKTSEIEDYLLTELSLANETSEKEGIEIIHKLLKILIAQENKQYFSLIQEKQVKQAYLDYMKEEYGILEGFEQEYCSQRANNENEQEAGFSSNAKQEYELLQFKYAEQEEAFLNLQQEYSELRHFVEEKKNDLRNVSLAHLQLEELQFSNEQLEQELLSEKNVNRNLKEYFYNEMQNLMDDIKECEGDSDQIGRVLLEYNDNLVYYEK